RPSIDRIDELGGMIRAIELGYPQKEITEAAWVYQQQVDRGEKTVVGVNRYQVPEGRRPELLRVPLEVEAQQADRVRRVKRERNAAVARDALARVREAATSGENLMPPLVAALKAMVTLGEISDVYRDVFGRYRDPAWLSPRPRPRRQDHSPGAARRGLRGDLHRPAPDPRDDCRGGHPGRRGRGRALRPL